MMSERIRESRNVNVDGYVDSEKGQKPKGPKEGTKNYTANRQSLLVLLPIPIAILGAVKRQYTTCHHK